MTAPRTVGVVGLGLIGGSIARELARRGWRVLGHDADAASLARALAEGVVQAPLGAGLERVAEADWLVLAVPVDAAGPLLRQALPRLGGVSLITDTGSTKRAVVATARELGIGERFVGSHPLAGDHRSGWAAARDGLFEGARVYLSPTPETAPAALAAAHELWRLLGAGVEVLDAEAHDRLLAWSSHLPQLVSTALAHALRSAGLTPAELGRGGRDMVRLAGSSPEMWTGIAMENADALDAALERVGAELDALRSALAAHDPRALRERLARGREWTGSAPA